MTPTQTERLYGIRDIAEALGTRRGTVAQWHRRGKLPPADRLSAYGPLWWAATIEPWIAERQGKAETG